MKKKKINYILEQEYSQSKLRLSIISLVLMIFIFTNSSKYGLVIAGSYFLYSLLIMLSIIKQQKASRIRRISNVIADVAVIAAAMHYHETNAIIMYPILIWLIIGSGMRFGMNYLFATLVVSEIGFATVLMNSVYMLEHKDVMYSLMFGLVALTLFYAALVKKLHTANSVLEKKVAHRVDQIKHLYIHDSLTGLKNRAALIVDLEKNSHFGVILIDIDSFHNYNELYGMEVGNSVLKDLSSFIQSTKIGKRYTMYRTYGDQFLLKSENENIDENMIEEDIKEIFNLFKSFKIDIDNLDDTLDIDITLGASLGKENILKMAEMALKHAKKRRVNYSIYTKNIDNTAYSKELLIWKDKIKKAISSDNIVPVYQAIVDKDNNIMKYEALMRLRDVSGDKEELISPFYFLDIAIKSKIYPQLTDIMIEKTFKDMKKNGHQFSINLTFEDMINNDIVRTLKSKIKKYDIGKQIIFEIVESENIDDFPYAKKFVHDFKSMGVRIAIDDFGTGYSNFTHIFELEPDFLKIDGSLIKNIQHDKKSYELVASIVHFSKSLGIETIAEFVSSKEIFEICKKLEIDQYQGFYFSTPLIYEKLEDYELKNKKELLTI